MSTINADTDTGGTGEVVEIPEAVAVLDNVDDLKAAIHDLRMSGFSRDDISLLGDEKTLEAKLGDAFWRSDDLADDPRVPRAAFVSEEAMGELEGATVGGMFFLGSAIAALAMLNPLSTAAASIAAIAIGGTPGAVLGAILARREGQHHADYYARQIAHGGLLLWVRVPDSEKKRLATAILKGHSGQDVHVHGWSK